MIEHFDVWVEEPELAAFMREVIAELLAIAHLPKKKRGGQIFLLDYTNLP